MLIMSDFVQSAMIIIKALGIKRIEKFYLILQYINFELTVGKDPTAVNEKNSIDIILKKFNIDKYKCFFDIIGNSI